LAEIGSGVERRAEVRQLPVGQLHPNSYNPNSMSDAEFGELVEEIRHLGRLPKPVVVRPVAGDEYEIVDGEHGWRASKEVGLAQIACEVIEADLFEAMRQTYKRNQHGTHDRVALGRMFRRMMDERGLSNRQLANEINVSEGTIRNALVLAKAGEVRKRYASSGSTNGDPQFEQMTVTQARHYLQLPEGLRDRWLDAGAPAAWSPETWGMPEGIAAEVTRYVQKLAETSIAGVFELGSWGENAKNAHELMAWRQKLLPLLGDDVDAYIRPVVELHSTDPTPVQILDSLPMHAGKPFLSPQEWAEALRVAWEKGETVYELLGLFRTIAKLKAGETGVPAEDLDDPRVALQKMEVEQNAPDFIREADIPLGDKHFLMKDADTYFNPRTYVSAARLSDATRLQLKRQVKEYLTGEYQRHREEVAAYQAALDEANLEQLAAGAVGGGGIRYPRGVAPVAKAWEEAIRGHHQALRQAAEEQREAEAAAILRDPDKVVETVVGKLAEAAPKVFGGELDGKQVARVLEERLRAMPQPERVLMAVVLLGAPPSAWLDAVREEEGGGAGS
jgi:ParB/RepB/Spo0J family partition protein